MYYVVKIYESSCVRPQIVEVFKDVKDACDYANIMNRSGKGQYEVLKPLD